MAEDVNNGAGIADVGANGGSNTASTGEQYTNQDTGQGQQQQQQQQGDNAGQQQQQQKTLAGQGIADPTPTPGNRGIADSQTSMAEQSKAQEPAVYDYELKANDGEELGFLQQACKELKLSKVQAEGMLAKLREASVHENRNLQEQQIAGARAIISGWQDEINRDPEFGGRAWATTCNNARRAFDIFDEDGEVQKILRESGFQHHPKIIRAIARIGAKFAEDKYIGSNGRQGRDDGLSLADRMYPGMNTKSE